MDTSHRCQTKTFIYIPTNLGAINVQCRHTNVYCGTSLGVINFQSGKTKMCGDCPFNLVYCQNNAGVINVWCGSNDDTPGISENRSDLTDVIVTETNFGPVNFRSEQKIMLASQTNLGPVNIWTGKPKPGNAQVIFFCDGTNLGPLNIYCACGTNGRASHDDHDQKEIKKEAVSNSNKIEFLESKIRFHEAASKLITIASNLLKSEYIKKEEDIKNEEISYFSYEKYNNSVDSNEVSSVDFNEVSLKSENVDSNEVNIKSDNENSKKTPVKSLRQDSEVTKRMEKKPKKARITDSVLTTPVSNNDSTDWKGLKWADLKREYLGIFG